MCYSKSMAKAKNPIQIQVPITLSPEAYEFAQKHAKDGDLSGTVASWCSYYLDNQARGGIALEPVDHQYLADLNGGKRFKDSRSLVTAVEKGLKREGGQFSVTVAIDPLDYPALKENAENANLTVEEFVDGIVKHIFASGWLYSFTPADGRSIPFSAQMLENTAKLCDKHKIDSSDIAGLIAEDRFIPITRETKELAGRLLPNKVDFNSEDIHMLLSELESLRKEYAELKVAPRELVAA